MTRYPRPVTSGGSATVAERISVVVPTHERPDRLARCLTALAGQTVVSRLEVLVVDDGTRDPATVSSVAAPFGFVRVLSLGRQGPAAARNAGVRQATGSVICFTDDDCRPQPDWAERLARRIAGGADAVAGSTVNGAAGNPFAEASQIIANHLMVPAAAPAAGLAFATSNNLACRADVARAVPFDERYRDAGGEDREWCGRLLDAGHVLAAEPGAVVFHDQELDLARFVDQQVRYGRGARRYRSDRASARRLEPPAFYLRLLHEGLRRGPATGALVAAAQVATAFGFAAERRRERQVARR